MRERMVDAPGDLVGKGEVAAERGHDRLREAVEQTRENQGGPGNPAEGAGEGWRCRDGGGRRCSIDGGHGAVLGARRRVPPMLTEQTPRPHGADVPVHVPFALGGTAGTHPARVPVIVANTMMLSS